MNIPPDFQPQNNADTLVILLHAIGRSARSLRYVKETVTAEFGSVAILAPDLPAYLFSFGDPNHIVQDLLHLIDQVWAAREPYRRILFIGHSLGALLSRKLYVCACGENPEAPFESIFAEKRAREWAPAVERLILLAGMNRGWRVSQTLSSFKAISLWTGAFLGHLSIFLLNRYPLAFHIRRGAPFITQLRIQWLAMRRRQETKGVGDAVTIQLLGSIDELVGPDDNVDLVTGKDFVYLDVPLSGHHNIIKLDHSDAGQVRQAILTKALTQDYESLYQEQILPTDINLLSERTREDVTDVIFVIHGIRDLGYWTHKIARKVKAKAAELGAERKFETETSSYGYFPMLPFLLPWVRRAKVEWLMDQYTENLALYPNADFSFVGHSNGTYLLAKALEEYTACHFKNVVFAGSVVRTNYPWVKLIEEGRIENVLNYVATADWVVAFFPRMFQMLRLQDLGSAGHDGFETLQHHQIKYVRGGHGAALKEKHWENIAHFIVHGTPDSDVGEQERRSPLITFGGHLAPLVWIILIAAILVGAVSIWNNLPVSEWAKTAALFLYGGFVWTVITRL